MQGIMTKMYGPFRIRASCKGRSIIAGRDDSLSHEKQHRAMAMKLAELMGWHGRWVSCTVPGVQGFIWANTREKLSERVFEIAGPAQLPSEPGEPGDGGYHHP